MFPLWSPGQTLYNNFGAITLYGFLFVVVTSYFRPKLRHRPWKKLHYAAYGAAAFMYVHGTLIDPNLKGSAAGLSGWREGAGGGMLRAGGGGGGVEMAQGE